MAYQRIPEGVDPMSVLEPAFDRKSRRIPYITVIPVLPDGEIGLIRPNQWKPWRLPMGDVFPPRPERNESSLAPVINTIEGSLKSCFGPGITADTDSMMMVPHKSFEETRPASQMQHRLWPRATSKLFIPIVVPVQITEDDPLQRYQTVWRSQEENLEAISGLITRHQNDRFYLKTARFTHDTLEVSLPTIQAVIEATTANAQAIQVGPS